MHQLTAGSFTLDLVDPAADSALMGNRYCWGGYPWRLHHEAHGDLLAGPEFPETPTAFNGQGLPEVFRHWDKDSGAPLNLDGDGGVIIGVGQGRWVGEDAEIVLPCSWQVERGGEGGAASACYATEDESGGWGYRLVRRVVLTVGGISIHSRITAHGERPLAVHWYAHPFLPITQPLNRVHLDMAASLADSPGYRGHDNGFAMREDIDWDRTGHFEWIDLEGRPHLDARIDHPVFGQLRLSGDFPVDRMPVWANDRTISIEPYRLAELAPGEAASWMIRYDWSTVNRPEVSPQT